MFSLNISSIHKGGGVPVDCSFHSQREYIALVGMPVPLNGLIHMLIVSGVANVGAVFVCLPPKVPLETVMHRT